MRNPKAIPIGQSVALGEESIYEGLELAYRPTSTHKQSLWSLWSS